MPRNWQQNVPLSWSAKTKPFRPGGLKHDVAHRAWRQPDKDAPVDTRKKYCWRCYREVAHPIHDPRYRKRGFWFGWKDTAGMSNIQKRLVQKELPE